MTTGELIAEYLSYINQRRAYRCKPPMTEQGIRMKEPIENMLNSGRPVKDYVTDYLKGKAPATQSWFLTIIKMFCEWMVHTGRYAENPVKEFVCPSPKQQPKETFSMEQIEYVITKVRMTPEQEILFRLTSESGLRCCELPRITVADLPTKGNLLTIHGKGNKDRYVPISNSSLALLRKSFENNPRKSLFTCSTKTLWRQYIDILKTAKMYKKGNVIHAMRRTNIMSQHREGVPLAVIQKVAGHENITTTQRYLQTCKADIEKLCEAALFQKLNKLYEEGGD